MPGAGDVQLGIRIALLGVVGILLGGCSLGLQNEIIGLDGRSLSAQESEVIRQTCPRDGDKWCLTARGYALVSSDGAAAARANLLQNAENNRRERDAAARTKEEARKRQIEQPRKTKKKIAGSNPAPTTKLLYDDVLCRHLATRRGPKCPAPFGMN
jgi:hypothetical protein